MEDIKRFAVAFFRVVLAVLLFIPIAVCIFFVAAYLRITKRLRGTHGEL